MYRWRHIQKYFKEALLLIVFGAAAFFTGKYFYRLTLLRQYPLLRWLFGATLFVYGLLLCMFFLKLTRRLLIHNFDPGDKASLAKLGKKRCFFLPPLGTKSVQHDADKANAICQKLFPDALLVADNDIFRIYKPAKKRHTKCFIFVFCGDNLNIVTLGDYVAAAENFLRQQTVSGGLYFALRGTSYIFFTSDNLPKLDAFSLGAAIVNYTGDPKTNLAPFLYCRQQRRLFYPLRRSYMTLYDRLCFRSFLHRFKRYL